MEKRIILQLQHRHKWKSAADNIQISQLVILKTGNTPPLVWDLGRVSEVFPGKDGMVRVANIKTSHGILKRSINQFYVLPVEDSM